MRFLRQFRNSFIFLAIILLIPFILLQVSAAAEQPRFPSELEAGSQDIRSANLEVAALLPVFRNDRHDPPPGDGPLFGVNFINSAEDLADEIQFQNGLATGASWNRWPIYWFNIETSSGSYDWSKQDLALRGDIAHGLQTNAILLGTPGFYTTSNLTGPEALKTTSNGMFEMLAPQAAAPVGLYEPVFSDGTDIPGIHKQINPNNKWARFTEMAVDRYQPGGLLAQQFGWANDEGITHWEIWNEPDLDIFWDSPLPDYARLLKVGYLAVKHSDPDAKVLFAGLANNFEKPNYYRDVLEIFAADPLAEAAHYYHDILATHSYFYAWQSWKHVYDAGQTMADFGFEKPIWLNETGVPAWDDYPGPVWDPKSPLRSTMEEQAAFVIQTAFYAAFAGADAIFHFQLYDGCGNQPIGTDFPPHNGELCGDPNNLCAGDANGLFRNPTDAACFTQHPNPESKRSNFDAYKVLTTYFRDVRPLWRERRGGTNPYNGPQELIAFFQPSTGQRIIGMWSRFGEEQTAEIEAEGSSATLVYPDGATETITPSNGKYFIRLPGATNQNASWDPTLYPIGGSPVILIEAGRNATLEHSDFN